MTSRIDWPVASPGALQALLHLSAYVEDCDVEARTLELVKLRASQINGCAYCIDMHSKDARAAGDTDQRLLLLDAWREAAHLYSEREQAALAWTEAVTHITDGHAPDDAYDRVHAHFNDKEVTDLTLAIALINGYNRMNIAFRVQGGGYRVGMFKQRKAA